MSKRGRSLTWAVLAAASALLIGPLLWRMAQAAQLAKQSVVYEQAPTHPAQRLLIVGDSTAVGTGASSSDNSLAGLIGQAHPRLHIDNRASDGATFADVLGQLQAAVGYYDIVLVQAGGNDVIRLRNLDEVGGEIRKVLQLAGTLGDQVLVMPSGNVGNAPFFLPPLSWLMSWRSRVLHEHVSAAAQSTGAVYVKLYAPAERDPFVQRPALNAADGLHPSDAGYRVWLQALHDQADLSERLAPSI